jgi:alkylhydroperoxidase family enzyme
MTWLATTAAGPTAFERVFGLRPELLAEFKRFYSLFWERELVDPVLLELCRLRAAQLLHCEPELGIRYRVALEAGFDEAKFERLEEGSGSDAFDPTEGAVLALTEGFVLDPHGLADDDVRRVVALLGEQATVALIEALAIYDGFARFRSVLGIEEDDAQTGSPRIVDAPGAPEGAWNVA